MMRNIVLSFRSMTTTLYQDGQRGTIVPSPEVCGADLLYEPGIADYNIRSRRAFQKNGYITYEIKLLPAGCKARCDYHLYITRERFNALKEATMNASDLREEFKYSLRASDNKVTLVDMPALPFLMFDGAGDPNTSPD
ncbi:MAG: hypothetical protein LLG44_06150, partial [Chloroflexi bacterium]|nr:hypothetical protein [Chloroflexota bacterium]